MNNQGNRPLTPCLKPGACAADLVNRTELAALAVTQPSCATLDDGERHLFAWLHAHISLPADAILVTTADKAALVASHDLGWLDAMVSLEFSLAMLVLVVISQGPVGSIQPWIRIP